MTALPDYDGHDDDEEAAAEQNLEPADPDGDPGQPDDDAYYEGEYGDRRPIIPAALWRENLAATVSHEAELRWYQARYHSLRAVGYLITYLFHAGRGGTRLTRRLLRWWQWTEGWVLESQAVAAGRAGHHDAMRAHTEGKKTRSGRGRIVAVLAAIVLVVAAVLVLLTPPWVWAAAALVLVAVLARHGRNAGQPVIRPAVIPPEYQPPTPEVITHALGSIGLPAIAKAINDGPGITFITDVHRDGEGWGCDLDLPLGVTARMIMERREQFASGLRRPLTATWPEPVPAEHEGRLRVWIGYHDMSKSKPKQWPLLKTGQADFFQPGPFGTDPRGRNINASLFEHNWLVGAAPGQGKTATVRVLASYAALDPIVELWTHEFSGKGDLEPFGAVSHRYCSGLDDESIAYAADSIAMLRAELGRRSKRFKTIDKADKPDGKLTRELAEHRPMKLRPIVAIFDECQNLFMHPQHGPEAAADLAYVMRLGRAYGIVVILATQRPDKDSLPTAISGIVTSRFCLRVPGHVENDIILGTGAHHNGYKATLFRAKTDAGLGWLKNDADPAVVKTYYLDLPATAKIVARARKLRDAAGTVTGYAVGEDAPAEEQRSFAADVLSVFGDGEDKLWTRTIAERLADRLPGVYASITPASVGSQLRLLRVEVKNVREPGAEPNLGCYRAAVEAAITP